MKSFLRLICLSAFTVLFGTGLALADSSAGMQAYKAGDYATATALLRPDADAGNQIAQNLMGVMYMKGGGGLPQSDVDAMEWFRRAADNGLAVAQTNVGFLYENGRGVTRDLAIAKSWYEKAAAQGDERAKIFLQMLPARQAMVDAMPPVTKAPAPADGTPVLMPTTPPRPAASDSVMTTESKAKAQDNTPVKKTYLIMACLIVYVTGFIAWSRTMSDTEGRPSTVTSAVLLLWISFALGQVNFLLHPMTFQRFSLPVPATMFAFISLIMIFWYVMIAEGRNWARVLFVLMTLPGFVFMMSSLPASFSISILQGLLTLIVSLFQVAAAFMVFTKAAAPWFNPALRET